MNIIKRLRIDGAMRATFPFFLGWSLSGFRPFTLSYLLLLISMCGFNLFIYLYNDLVDAPYDAKDNSKKERNIFCENKNSKRTKILLLTFALSCYVPAIFISGRYFALSIFCLIFSILYSGPFLRAKSKPVLDVLFHSFWPVITFFASYYFFEQFTLTLFLFGALLFMFSAASQLSQEIRDYTVDKETNQNTTVQVIGLSLSKKLRLILFYFILLFPCVSYSLHRNLFLLLLSICSILVMHHYRNNFDRYFYSKISALTFLPLIFLVIV